MSPIGYTSFPSDGILFPPLWRQNHAAQVSSTSSSSSHDGGMKKTRPFVGARLYKNGSAATLLILDVPGVQPNDIQVLLMNDTLLKITGVRKVPSSEPETTSFSNEYKIDPTKIDPTNLKANVCDGVLIVTMPTNANGKRPPKRSIEVTPQESNDDAIILEDTDDDDDNTRILRLPIDVPGVKLEDLTVELSNNFLQVVGIRRRIGGGEAGGTQSRLIRQYDIDTSKFDTGTMKAVLLSINDGVLLITINAKKKKTQQVPRAIEVTIGPHPLLVMESNNNNNSSNHDHDHDHEHEHVSENIRTEVVVDDETRNETASTRNESIVVDDD